MTKTLTLDDNGRPLKDWSGRVQAAKVLRAWINGEHPEHVTTDEAEEKAEAIVRAYLGRAVMSDCNDISDEKWQSSYDAWKTDAPAMPSQGRSQHGPVHARIKERDCHDLWEALRTFRAAYGEAELQRVLEESTR